MKSFFIPFIITLLSGLGTGLGGIISVVAKEKSNNFLGLLLGIAAGAMISLSIIEIIPEALNYLLQTIRFHNSFLILVFGFIIGTIIIIIINKVTEIKITGLYKTGIVNMIAVILHNLPEGIIVFMMSTENLYVGITLAIGIAVHNIPEGIAIATPIYYSTKNRTKSILLALSSGSVEVIGGILCFFLLKPIINNITIGFVLSIVGGIMIYLSLYNLIPEALKYNKKQTFIGLIAGGIIILITHLFL